MDNYINLKTAIIEGRITVNTVYLPANYKIFSIIFHQKDLTETVIRAVTGEKVTIKDPLAEHRNDIIKATSKNHPFAYVISRKTAKSRGFFCEIDTAHGVFRGSL